MRTRPSGLDPSPCPRHRDRLAGGVLGVPSPCPSCLLRTRADLSRGVSQQHALISALTNPSLPPPQSCPLWPPPSSAGHRGSLPTDLPSLSVLHSAPRGLGDATPVLAHCPAATLSDGESLPRELGFWSSQPRPSPAPPRLPAPCPVLQSRQDCRIWFLAASALPWPLSPCIMLIPCHGCPSRFFCGRWLASVPLSLFQQEARSAPP